jgi:hypothetical protein
MADSVWHGSRPFVRWAAICAQIAFYGTQVGMAGAACVGVITTCEVLHAWQVPCSTKIEQSFCCAVV